MSNLDLMEQNEVNANANGGTELFMRFLYRGDIPRELLEQVQIIPGRIRELKEDKIRILTLHDLPGDPEFQKLSDPAYRKKFHKIVYISNWQQQQFMNTLHIPYDNHGVVIESGIEPAECTGKPTDRVNIGYFTTPHRGLNILLPAFAKLAETDKNIQLHVHSSFKIYGWSDQDNQFEQMFEFARNHPQITYYGYTEHSELLERIKDYHIFAYPSIWPETACRAMLEAMTARLVCVHPNFAALPDTSGGLNFMYPGSSVIKEHGETFLISLGAAVQLVREDSKELNANLDFNKQFVDSRYNPDMVTKRWIALLKSLVNRYPTTESRKISNDQIWIVDTNKR